ncbi:PQQ-binding-like beta-propeller repeat protein [Nitratiruptor sp. YY09-18]|uniref:outer membrane protein assembly factor BamB family protein n=1 Tax=Nitratiruptor sp. YY09-18 TaxID=2724901 RepID=UPI00191667B3|nr:PQQ-binding-like beta-propeller repeat protein [Nitratiruptor sp. YY09-18]BCD67827.1 hypothetical protein NitYY0918_C0734 [Nitratiruptor sp. YY09-18]
MKKVVILLLTALLFLGCSNKRYFEPQEVAGYVDFDGTLPAKIVDVLRDGATLDNGQFISRDGLEDYKFPQNFIFLHKSGGYYIATSKCGELQVVDTKSKKLVFDKKFDMKTPVAASIKGNYLALVMSDNTLMLYDLSSQKVVYSSKQKPAIAVDTKVANPFFLDSLVIFPTLDGKLVVVDPRSAKEVRNIVVGSAEHFNNIIFLNVIDEKLIAATPNRIVSINPSFMNSLDVDLSDVLYVKERVYLLTKDGRIILTDPELNPLKQRKFPFAHFTGAIYGEYIYVIEKGGYLLALDKDLRASNIFSFASTFGIGQEIDEYIFTSKDKVFYADKFFKLNKL